MRISRKTDYGVILLEELRPTYKTEEFTSLTKIAQARGLPSAFAEKLAETLRKAGWLEAKRGVDGGYRLVRNPKRITLKEVLEVFSEPLFMRCMVSSHPERACALVSICPSRKRWLSLQDHVMNAFDKVTLAEF